MSTNKNQLEMETEIAFRIECVQVLNALNVHKALAEAREKLPFFEKSETLQICWDTRSLPSTNKVLFVARKGGKFDGHTLAQEYLERGYAFAGEPGAVMRHLREKGETESVVQSVVGNPRFLPVLETETALKIILDAALEFRAQDFTSIAITGTSGKTSTTQIASFLWEELSRKQVVRLGTLGIQVGKTLWDGSHPTMPDYPGFLSALTAAHRAGIQHTVFEATSHGLVGKRLGDWEADVAVFTNLSQDHLDFHKTMAAYRSCKGILFEKHLKPTGTAVLNTDDPEWPYFVSRMRHRTQKIIGFGNASQRKAFTEATNARETKPIFMEIFNATSNHIGIRGNWRLFVGDQLTQEANFECPLLGVFQQHNLAAAAASMVALGFSLKDVAKLVGNVPGIPGRLEHAREPLATPHPTVLVDYAHKPDALEKTLQTLKAITPTGGKLVCVFGCGGDRDSSKRPIMGKISSKIADITYVTSDNPRTEDPGRIVSDVMAGIANGAKAKAIVDRREAIFEALTNAGEHDVVVIAGKGHEDYQIVGTQKFPFSDFDIARDALLARRQKQKE